MEDTKDRQLVKEREITQYKECDRGREGGIEGEREIERMKECVCS